MQFIYQHSGDYYSQKFTVEGEKVRHIYYSHLLLNYTTSKDTIKNFKINREIRKLVAKNDILISTSDFKDISIVTTGGIIIADEIPEDIRVDASRKRDQRKEKCERLFPGYKEGNMCFYTKNKDIIKSLLDLEKELLKNYSSNLEIYSLLLLLLIESVNPYQSSEYLEKANQFIKKYSKF